MPSFIHSHVYVCSVVYICKDCVCPHGTYGVLDYEIKLYLSCFRNPIILPSYMLIGWLYPAITHIFVLRVTLACLVNAIRYVDKS